ncbi:MAG: 2-aminoethylphosphonate--pyruvate transaminase [Deltaproteobacteria bacterium]|nr:2-aminoethylphosphonate--pyruvate transaminase [Deltaproteobacteria bacterium]MBW2695612.1 2-aminoethylphosphonate--pyruvate transaminase [Deltaproteobacteria bacterium]
MHPVERRVLLNPGPATTTQSVKDALVIPDVCPREKSFCDLYADVRRRLALLAGDLEEVLAIPIVGSGTTALEAMLVSFVPPDGLIVIVDNGDYGTRLANMAAGLDIPHRVVEMGWGRKVDWQAVEAVLEETEGRATHLCVVHHETSSGMLNSLDDALAVSERAGVRVLLDAMSSFGGMPIHVGRGGVDALVSSSNKCVQGMPGLGIVIATRELIDDARSRARRCFTLDLVAESDHLEKTGQSRFTLPPQVVSALHRALCELESEGLEGRQRRYAASMAALTHGLDDLGFERLLEDEQQSGILVAIREPQEPWYDFEALHDAMDVEGFTIYPGKPGAVPTFRLAVLGAIDESDIRAFLTALRRYLERVRG